MLFRIVLLFILGYVNIEVEGFYIERFMNKCINSKIFIWNIKRKNDTRLYCNISINDFKKLRKIAKQTKCKIRINNKNGIPFFINKYKKRKIFGIFLLLILFSIFILSRFVWNIEIKGIESINESELRATLKESGLDIGILKNSIDTNSVIEKVRLNRDDIAWVGIRIEGTNVIVEVVESTPKPEILDKNEYCNIVSDKSGIITKIDITNGTAAVKVGDAVDKGTIIANRMDGRKIYWDKICSCNR